MQARGRVINMHYNIKDSTLSRRDTLQYRCSNISVTVSSNRDISEKNFGDSSEFHKEQGSGDLSESEKGKTRS